MKKQCLSIALPLIFILMALSACSNTSDPSFSLDPMPTATASPNPTPGSQDRVSIERVDKSVLTDDGKTLAYIYFDKPVVLGDSDAAAKINMYFENIYLDWASEGNGEMSESDTISSPGAINSLLESLNHIRENDGDDYLLQPGYSLNHTLRSEVMLSDPDTLSIRHVSEWYAGGGRYFRIYGSTFDLKTGELIPCPFDPDDLDFKEKLVSVFPENAVMEITDKYYRDKDFIYIIIQGRDDNVVKWNGRIEEEFEADWLELDWLD